MNSAIPPNSTSFPTHAVIIHRGITDGEQRQKVWALSEAIYRCLRKKALTSLSLEVNAKRAALEAFFGTREAYDIYVHLRDNHQRSIETFTREHLEQMERQSA